MKYKKRILVSLFLLMILLPSSVISFAAQEDIILTEKINISENFDFGVSDTCSSHPYFLQAAAREDGMFLICSHYFNRKEPSPETYQRQYIDVYNSDGTLYKEYSFFTQLPYVTELCEDSVNIYFQTYMVQISLETEDLHCYSIVTKSDAAFDHLGQEIFSVGQWEYRCEGGPIEYRRLIRNNGETEEVLVEMPGSGMVASVVVPAFTAVILAVVLIVLIVQKKKRKKNEYRS